MLGNVRELGGWAVEQAFPMQRQDTAQNGQEWTAQVLLQHWVTVEYKFIKSFSKRTKLSKEAYDTVVRRWHEFGLAGNPPPISVFEEDQFPDKIT